MSHISDSTTVYSVLEDIQHYITGSDDMNNNDKLDMSETHKEFKIIDHNKCVMIFWAVVSFSTSYCVVKVRFSYVCTV